VLRNTSLETDLNARTILQPARFGLAQLLSCRLNVRPIPNKIQPADGTIIDINKIVVYLGWDI